MTEQELKNLIRKKQQKSLTKKEEATLLSFEKKMLERNREHIFLDKKHKSKISSAIYSKIQHKKQIGFGNGWMKIAAILVITITLGSIHWYFSPNKQHSYNTQPKVTMLQIEAPFGKKRTFNLPDGSIVKLNSGSKIKYPEIFNDSIREVTLSGEAFFEIKKDSSQPFIVKTSSLFTRVLGTSFNIKAYEDEDNTIVTLATGKISVGTNQKDEIILNPSHQAILNKKNKRFTKQKIDLNKTLSWKNGILRFDNEKLATAIPKLEKWFNVKIKLKNKNSAECAFTGIFENASLESILENITFVNTTLKYKFITSNEIEISGYCNN